MELSFIEMGKTLRNSLALDMLSLRYLLDIQMRYQEFKREVQAGDINLSVVIMRIVFQAVNQDEDHQKSECGK